MENDDDLKLRRLLREWQIPGAPASLDERVLRRSRPRWAFLLTGSIRVPVPVGLAIAAALLMMAGALLKQKSVAAPAAPPVSLVDFRPVRDLNIRVIRTNELR
jgi:hypothetical protein